MTRLEETLPTRPQVASPCSHGARLGTSWLVKRKRAEEAVGRRILRRMSIPDENSTIVPVENSPTHLHHIQFPVPPDAAEPSADRGRRALGVAETLRIGPY